MVKKFILFIIISTIQFNLYAQINSNESINEIEYFVEPEPESEPESEPKEEGEYKNGLMEGVWKTFYKNGKIKSIGKYINGRKDGIWKTFYENGNLRLVEKYKHFIKKKEIWHSYFPYEKKYVYKIIKYRGNKYIIKRYFDNGNISSIEKFKNHKLTGTLKEYWKNGNYSKIAKYHKGKLISKKYYYKNGQLKESIKYKNGKLYNIISSYNPKGEKLNIGTFKNGNGIYYKYDYIGRLINVDKYKEGEFFEIVLRRGYHKNSKHLTYENRKISDSIETTKRFLIDGSLQAILKSHKGKLISEKTYYKNGQLKENVEFKNSRLYNIISSFNPKGEKLNIGTFKNGNGNYYHYNDKGLLININRYKDGVWVSQVLHREYFHNSTQLSSETTNMNNYKTIKTFWKNGNYFKINKFHKNNLISQKTYYKNGQLKENREYRNGGLYNIISSFNPKGEKLKIGTFKNGKGTYFEYGLDGKLIGPVHYN